MEYICEKLGITKEYFLELMNGENKTYKDYKNSARKINFAIKVVKLLGIEKRNFR